MVYPSPAVDRGIPAPSLAGEVVQAALIGAGVVAIWFLAIDLIRGQLLFTPAALGSAIFLGARGVGEVQVSALTVLGYTAVHVLGFLLVALLAVVLIRNADFEPPLVLGAALLFVVLEVFVLGVIAILASWLLDALSFWTVAVANLLAAASMGFFLWQRHPLMHDGFRADMEERQ